MSMDRHTKRVTGIPENTLPVPKIDEKNIKRHSIHGITEDIDKIKPHQEIGRLSTEEKKYLLAVERGDVALIRKILAENENRDRKFNINCVDPLGRSAVMMSIENENLEIMKLLIENDADTKEALLCAISEQFVEAVEVLLDYEEKHHKPGTPYSWELSSNNTAMFTRDITPLILAAHRDNYEIIKILLDKGAEITIPHDVKCGCSECVESQQVDSLQHSYSRINAYRALSSPSFIALSSEDPILTAFELSWELRRLSILEHEFKSEYQELRKKCQDFATALLDHVRTSTELEILLNHDREKDSSYLGRKMRLERLKLAVKLRQKRFVAHPNVQQLLASMWYEGLPGFRRKNIALQLWKIISIGLLFPLFSLIYIIAPRSQFGSVLQKPFIKFICHSASYIIFLLLLMVSSMRQKSATDVSLVEFSIMFWVFGLVWSEIKQYWKDGFKQYTKELWNMLDVLTNSLYMATIVLRVYILLRDGKRSYKGNNRLEDPIYLLYEALFSTANILSALKLVYIFSVNPYLGPLQIVLSRMIIDIAKFFLWYVLVLFAFSCGIYQLLGRYQNDYTTNETGNYTSKDDNRTDKFSNLFETVQTLFWSAFGVIELDESFDLNGITWFTKFWGMLTFGTFCVISIVVLLNLLIAMMNHSYQHIFDDADVEWKFARSRLWISYFNDCGSVPPPFNIIPTPKSLWYFIQNVQECCCTTRERNTRISMAVTRNLVQRYIMSEQKKTGDHAMITLDDINEVKQDISAFRYELLDILKTSGMNITIPDDPSSYGNKRRRKPPNYIHLHSNTFGSFGTKLNFSPTVSPQRYISSELKTETPKFNFRFFPSIFQGKPLKSSCKQKPAIFHLEGKSSTMISNDKSKCETLEKLFERGTVSKHIVRSQSEDDVVNQEFRCHTHNRKKLHFADSNESVSTDIESSLHYVDENSGRYHTEADSTIFTSECVELGNENIQFNKSENAYYELKENEQNKPFCCQKSAPSSIDKTLCDFDRNNHLELFYPHISEKHSKRQDLIKQNKIDAPASPREKHL